MHDIIPPKRDLFKFGEISDNILFKVHDRDIVAIKH